jgi:hypothetical protein
MARPSIASRGTSVGVLDRNVMEAFDSRRCYACEVDYRKLRSMEYSHFFGLCSPSRWDPGWLSWIERRIAG